MQEIKRKKKKKQKISIITINKSEIKREINSL